RMPGLRHPVPAHPRAARPPRGDGRGAPPALRRGTRHVRGTPGASRRRALRSAAPPAPAASLDRRAGGAPPAPHRRAPRRRVERIGAYAKAGAEWVILALRAPFDWEGLDLFVRDVLPAFRS